MTALKPDKKKIDSQVSQLCKLLDKVSALEAQQNDQSKKVSLVQHWCEQLRTEREQDALVFKEQFDLLKGGFAEQDQSILTIQDKLSRLSKELYISSDQVTVKLHGTQMPSDAPSSPEQSQMNNSMLEVSGGGAVKLHRRRP